MKDVPLGALLESIAYANADEINAIMNVLSEHFGEVYPDHELLTITIQGHDRQSHLDALQKSMDLLKSCH